MALDLGPPEEQRKSLERWRPGCLFFVLIVVLGWCGGLLQWCGAR